MTVDLERSLVALADSLEFPGESDAGRSGGRPAGGAAVPSCNVRPFAARWRWPRPRSSSSPWSWWPVPGPGGPWRTCWASAASPSRPARRCPPRTVPATQRPPPPCPAVSAPVPARPPGRARRRRRPSRPRSAGRPPGWPTSAQRLGIPPPVPTALGPPAAVTFGPPPPGGELALVWPPSASLPPTAIPGVGALLSVFRAEVDEAFVQKTLSPGTTYERVLVNGRPAIWLAGSPHLFLYRRPGRRGGAADAAVGRQHPHLDRRALHVPTGVGPRPGPGDRGRRDRSGNQLVGRRCRWGMTRALRRSSAVSSSWPAWPVAGERSAATSAEPVAARRPPRPRPRPPRRSRPRPPSPNGPAPEPDHRPRRPLAAAPATQPAAGPVERRPVRRGRGPGHGSASEGRGRTRRSAWTAAGPSPWPPTPRLGGHERHLDRHHRRGRPLRRDPGRPRAHRHQRRRPVGRVGGARARPGRRRDRARRGRAPTSP